LGVLTSNWSVLTIGCSPILYFHDATTENTRFLPEKIPLLFIFTLNEIQIDLFILLLTIQKPKVNFSVKKKLVK